MQARRKSLLCLLLILALSLSLIPAAALADEPDDRQELSAEAVTTEGSDDADQPGDTPEASTDEAAAEEAPEDDQHDEQPEGSDPEPVEEETGAPAEDDEPAQAEEEEILIEEEPVPEVVEDAPVMLLGAGEGSGSTGGSTGGNYIGGGAPGTGGGGGTLEFSTIGVTMEVVYYKYGDCYNRYNSYNCVINTVTNTQNTVLTGDRLKYVFLADPSTGRIYEFGNLDCQGTGTVSIPYSRAGEMSITGTGIDPRRAACVSGAPSVSGRYVTMPAANGVEQFLQRVIFGSSYGAWDISDVATASSVYYQLLGKIGCDATARENYLKAYNGQLNLQNDANVMIPTIVWSFIVAESKASSGGGDNPYNYTDSSALFGTWNSKYITGFNTTAYSATVYPVRQVLTDNAWWMTPYGSQADCAYAVAGHVSGYSSNDSAACQLMIGRHGDAWVPASKNPLVGTGLINMIQAEGVDKTNGAKYFFRNYWTPFGLNDPEGTLQIQKQTSLFDGTEHGSFIIRVYKANAALNGPAGSELQAFVTGSSSQYSDISYTLAPGWYWVVEDSSPAWDTYSVTSGSAQYSSAQNLRTVGGVDSAGNAGRGRAVQVAGSMYSYVKFYNNYRPGLFLVKTSANPALTNGNSCYSLAGAVYGLYTNAACTVEVATATTDASGTALLSNSGAVYWLSPNTTYYVKEKTASPGYLLDSTVYPVTVPANPRDNIWLPVTEQPGDDPDKILISKTANSGSVPITSGSAVFKVEYYPNDSWSGSPTRTWYYKTINGRCMLGNEDYLDTSKTNSVRWFNGGGEVTYPLGTLRVSEFEAPAGYTRTDTVLDARVTQDTPGGKGVWHWVSAASGEIHYTAEDLSLDNAPIPGKLDVRKELLDGTAVPGCTFLLEYSANGGASWAPVFAPANAGDLYAGTCTTAGLIDGQLTTGDDGHAVFEGLLTDGIVQYRMTELNAPEGYALLAEPFVVGALALPESAEGTTVEVTVTDTFNFALPHTGGSGFWFVPLAMLLFVPAALLPFRKEKDNA